MKKKVVIQEIGTHRKATAFEREYNQEIKEDRTQLKNFEMQKSCSYGVYAQLYWEKTSARIFTIYVSGFQAYFRGTLEFRKFTI